MVCCPSLSRTPSHPHPLITNHKPHKISRRYLLTDNYVSQRLFLDKYGPEKILVFALIPPPPTNATEAAAAMLEEGYQLKGSPDGLKEVDPSTGLPSDHRHTSLEHAVLDVLVAAHARNFKPAMYSSLSDVVQVSRGLSLRFKGIFL